MHATTTTGKLTATSTSIMGDKETSNNSSAKLRLGLLKQYALFPGQVNHTLQRGGKRVWILFVDWGRSSGVPPGSGGERLVRFLTGRR